MVGDGKAELVEESDKYVVTVRPGSAAETAMRFELSEDELDITIEECIRKGLGLNHERRVGRTAERIQAEMKNEYGLTANRKAVGRNIAVRDFFEMREFENDGQIVKYRGVEIVVASKQIGGGQGGIEYRV